MDSFPPTERRVALYILENRETILGTGIGQLSQACHTSKTSVVRLCKQLGYQGYKDFCQAISAQKARDSMGDSFYGDLTPGASLREIIHDVYRRNLTGLQSTMQLLSVEEVGLAVEVLHTAKRVDFYGVGNSAIVALDGQNKFLRIGKVSLTSMDPHVQIVCASSLGAGDVAVFLSYSGETLDTLATLDVALEAGATTLSITKYAPNTLSNRAKINLRIAASEGMARSGAKSSRLAMLHLVDILLSAVSAQEYEHVQPLLDRSLRAANLKRFK